MSSKRPPVFLFYDVMKNSLSTIFDATFLQAKPQDGIFHDKLKSKLDTFIDLLVYFFFRLRTCQSVASSRIWNSINLDSCTSMFSIDILIIHSSNTFLLLQLHFNICRGTLLILYIKHCLIEVKQN